MKSFILPLKLNSRFAFVEEPSPVRYASKNSNILEVKPKPDSWRQKNQEPSYAISTNRRSPKSLRLKSWFGLHDPDDPRLLNNITILNRLEFIL